MKARSFSYASVILVNRNLFAKAVTVSWHSMHPLTPSAPLTQDAKSLIYRVVMDTIRITLTVVLFTYSSAIALGEETAPKQAKYPYKSDIVTTCFWVGEGTCGYGSTDNTKSAWDGNWVKNFGGVDHPTQRTAASGKPGAVSLPATFIPHKNPYYVALPFNDIKFLNIARKVVPWWNEAFFQANPTKSQCHGRWIKIYYQGRVCYAQWEDVGPLREDHYEYVFGSERPAIHTKAGLDVSPAVRDYLGLNGLNKTTWRFVDAAEVPLGPWVNLRFSGPVAGQPAPVRPLPSVRLPIASTQSIGAGSYYGTQ